MSGDNIDKYGKSALIGGIAMVFFSLFTQGIQSNVEEYVLKKYQIEPQRMVGCLLEHQISDGELYL